MKEITINNKKTGLNNEAYIAAEIGLNHNRDIDLAKKMIKAAKDSGADAVKFQTYITEKLLNAESPAFKLFKDLELNKNDFKIISGYCRQIGITFFSTPFCLSSVDMLEELEVPCYKIASMDLNYFELIKYAAQTKKPLILSTGMGTLGEIDNAVNTAARSGNNSIIILHTISKYPPEYQDMNLTMISKLKSIYSCPIGFSDHTLDNTSSIIARTLGASFFEKHFTLDKNLPGPDHKISLEPADLSDLKSKLNAADRCLAVTDERADNIIKKGARRSLYAAADINQGDIFTQSVIDIIRPENGLAPEFAGFFIGKKAVKKIKKGGLIDFTCI